MVRSETSNCKGSLSLASAARVRGFEAKKDSSPAAGHESKGSDRQTRRRGHLAR